MKLATLILPMQDNNGTHLTLEHAQLRSQIVQLFGGYTMHDGFGAWANGGSEPAQCEPVIVYMIAMERQRVIELRSLAQRTARDCRQDCVMIVTPNGDVEFIKAYMTSIDQTIRTG